MMNEDILNEYKRVFKEYIVDYCKQYNHGLYDEGDLNNFENIAEAELDAHIENVGLEEIDIDNPEDDAKECISYWCY